MKRETKISEAVASLLTEEEAAEMARAMAGADLAEAAKDVDESSGHVGEVLAALVRRAGGGKA